MFLSLLIEALGSDNEEQKQSNNKKYCYNSIIEEFDKSKYYKFEETGTSSHYGNCFHNRKTASGELYDMRDFTAAHRKLPFGTILRVTNLEDNKKVFVKVSDRGPFIRKRIIDLSGAAANELGIRGLSKVKIEGLVIPQDTALPDINQEYYFGYSYEHNLVCFPESIINFIDSTESLIEANDMYPYYINIYPNDLIYLFVNINNTNNNDEEDCIYKIGVIKKINVEIKLTKSQIIDN